jgi:hypothetical protein
MKSCYCNSPECPYCHAPVIFFSTPTKEHDFFKNRIVNHRTIKDWKRGDRVQREIDIYNLEKGMRTGTVVFKYGYRSAREPWMMPETDLGYYPELYAVKWDDNPAKIKTGYLRHGLSEEENPDIDWSFGMAKALTMAESIKSIEEMGRISPSRAGFNLRWIMGLYFYQTPLFTIREHLNDCFGFAKFRIPSWMIWAVSVGLGSGIITGLFN